jgi:predicted transcriptional regulator
MATADTHPERIQTWLAKNGGEDGFFALVAEGKPLAQIAKVMGVSLPAVHRWLDTDRVPLRGRLRDAKRDSAEVHAEKAGEILDELEGKAVTSAEVQLANSRSKYRQWLAGVYDRETFGDQKSQVNVQFNIGSLMLEALQVAGRRDEIAPVVEAELLPPAAVEGDEVDE